VLFFIFLSIEIFGLAQEDSLFERFQNPPSSSHPRTWWHWTKGNVSKEGITKDLEWMRRVGIEGFQLADVNFGGGQTSQKKINFGTDEWYDAVNFSTEEAERLDLEMAIFSSPGWSITGGPWITPERAMKKIVWSDTVLMGPQKYFDKLPNPPSNNGPFQDYGAEKLNKENSDPTFYKDIAVFAYKLPGTYSDMISSSPSVTSSSGKINSQILFDEKYSSSVNVKSDSATGIAWIEYGFDKPFVANAFTISGSKGVPVGRLSASDDGKNFNILVELPGAQLYRQGYSRTFSIPETKAKYYRIEFIGSPLNPAETMKQTENKPLKEYGIREAKLYSEPRINRWEEKAGFRHLFEYESVPTPNYSEKHLISQKDLIDLTPKLNNNGKLNWKVPGGNWKIIRMGYSLTGAKNRPAVPSGLGFEVDKLSKKHSKFYIEQYIAPIKNKLRSLFGERLSYVIFDSWEAGMQNWTDDMINEFKKRRGYDPTPYLPALVGRVIESSEISDRFLWDFRRTLADMFAENHYGAISNYLKKQGIKTYGEASGVSLEILEDALLCKKYMDIPMGEFWVKDLHPSQMYYEDIRGAASAAHAYGKNIAAAEAFTGGGYESPFKLKKIADYWFCQGVNRLVFHTSAHQPSDEKPGNIMVGTHLNRNITWAEDAKPFIDYLSRVSYMLQQGKFSADVAYLLDEGAPSSMPIWGDGLKPRLPEGYDYDYINIDILLKKLDVDKTGNLILTDSMNYKILVLPEIDKMTLPVLNKIEYLIKNGATIVGQKPSTSPSLGSYPNSDFKVKEIASKIWADLDGQSRNHKTYGKGNVFWGWSLEKVLSFLKINKDIEYSKPLDSKISWIHRKAGDKDVYFVVNDSEENQNLQVRFRVKDKVPQLWFPDTGERKSLKYYEKKNMTILSLNMVAHGSVFVIFGSYNQKLNSSDQNEEKTTIASINNNWHTTFKFPSGKKLTIEINDLDSWTNNSNPKIKYFSGSAIYENTFNLNSLKSDERVLLDLGNVKDIAKVYLNGKYDNTFWKPPYTSDITDYLKTGENKLEVEVTNEWTNRIIGDLNLKESERSLHLEKNTFYFFGPPPELQESGLMGPVLVKTISK